MAEQSYHYRKKRKLKKKWRFAVAIFVVLVVLIAGVIGWDIYKNRSQPQTGAAKITELTYDNKGPKLTVNEPTFTLQLPGDWKEVGRMTTSEQHNITWQSTKAKEDNRFMTLYIDKIPHTLAVNKLLPLEAVGNKLRHGEISDNCAAYTEGGELDANSAAKAKDTPAKWEEVTFMCDLPKVFDNVVGTSSREGINTVSVVGKEAGKHSYFFTYTDHNVRPDYTFFTDIIESFAAR